MAPYKKRTNLYSVINLFIMRISTRLFFIIVLMASLLPLNLAAQYLVSGSENPDVNGNYVADGTYNDKPTYYNGNFYLYYKDCTTKWAIGTLGNCPEYSTYSDGEKPTNDGWHSGGKYSGSIEGTIMVAAMNSLAYEKNWFLESAANNGSFSDSIRILLNSADSPFTGENGEDFVATGKVVVSNLPEGLTMKVIRTGDSTMTAVISGIATQHDWRNDVSNLTLAFQNRAFADYEASDVAFSTYDKLNVLFMENYLVFGADINPEVNDTFYLAGLFNNRPCYTNGDYHFRYKGCQYGSSWVLASNGQNCPLYSTSAPGDRLPVAGWYNGGQGDGTDDTLIVAMMNSIIYNKDAVQESSADDGSITDSIMIAYFAPVGGNTFSGNNGDDFVTDGKAVVANLPEGLTARIIRTSDTTLVLRFTGKATNHESETIIDNLTITLNNSAFALNNAGEVINATQAGLTIRFMLSLIVYGANFIPEVNGVYVWSGTYRNKPYFENEYYKLGYRGCNATWVIVDIGGDIGGGCPAYSTSTEGNFPPFEGWSDGGQGGNGDDTIFISRINSLVYSSAILMESQEDNGAFDEPVTISYMNRTGGNAFNGAVGDDFVADGKIVVDRVPAGLTAKSVLINDTTLLFGMIGNAVNHDFVDNVDSLRITFLDAAFTGNKASTVYNNEKRDMRLIYVMKYEVFDAENNPDVNGTYTSVGMHNDKLYFDGDGYLLGYRGCNTQWAIVDGSDPDNLNRGYCPIYKNTTQDLDMPPVTGWTDQPVSVQPHNSLLYSKTTIIESDRNDGSLDNSDTLVISYFMPKDGAHFTGANGSNFVADGKVLVTNLPDGIVVSAIRTSDSTLSVVFNGQSVSGDVNNVTFEFSNDAFEGISAARVFYSKRSDLVLNFHNEYLVASVGGDFSTILEAINSPRVSSGDILNLAAETFTENDLSLNKAIKFKGKGPGKTIVQADENPGVSATRIFTLNFNSIQENRVVFENLTMRNGNAGDRGGAIYNTRAHLVINNCEFIDNYAYYSGGAVYSDYAELICTNTTFSGNRVNYPGNYYTYGGSAMSLFNGDSESALVENCTFVNNSNISYGGALIIATDSTKIVNCTFSNNSAAYGGAIYVYSYTPRLINVLVANNTASAYANDIYGSVDVNYSLIESATGATITGANNITGTDPGLLLPAYNGGTTMTCAIPTGSVAKDNGTNTGTPEKDQRGMSIFNGIRDIGAYEFNDNAVILVSDTLLSIQTVAGDTLEFAYDLSAVNLNTSLKLETYGDIEISLATEDLFTSDSVLVIEPDVQGTINTTTVYVRVISNTIGSTVAGIIHSSNTADTVDLVLDIMVKGSPEGDNDAVVIPVNQIYAFKADDFTFSDPDGDPFVGITVVSRETTGDLEYNDVNITEGTVCTDITKVTFRPFDDEFGKPYASFTFRVKDGSGLMSHQIYTMTVSVNNVPLIQNPIPDGNARVGDSYNYAVPENTFADGDAEDNLTWSATLVDGSSLPAWLSFDPATRTFSGVPVTAGPITIKVTATDPSAATGSDEYVLTVAAASGLDDIQDAVYSVYPNPSTGWIKVSLKNTSKQG